MSQLPKGILSICSLYEAVTLVLGYWKHGTLAYHALSMLLDGSRWLLEKRGLQNHLGSFDIELLTIDPWVGIKQRYSYVYTRVSCNECWDLEPSPRVPIVELRKQDTVIGRPS